MNVNQTRLTTTLQILFVFLNNIEHSKNIRTELYLPLGGAVFPVRNTTRIFKQMVNEKRILPYNSLVQNQWDFEYIIT